MIKKLLKRKIIIIPFLIILILGGYFGYKNFVKKEEETRYVMAAVEKGTIVVSVSGSGQVTVLDQVDIKPNVSGEISAIYIKKDQGVKAGQLLALLDSTDAERLIRDAQTSLDDAKRDLDKAEENYQDVKTDAENSLATAYQDGYKAVSTTFFKLSDYMSNLQNVLGTKQDSLEYISAYRLILGSDSVFITRLLEDYNQANELFNKNFVSFRTIFQDADHSTIYQLIDDTLETTKAISQALESARHMYDAIVVEDYAYLNVASHINSTKPEIESDVSSVYSNISSLQKIKDTIDDTNKNTPKNIEEAQLSIQSAKNNVTKKEETLSDVKAQFVECSIYAPFSGIIASINDDIKKGDSVSSGTVLATLITKQKIAKISLNEVDAAKVKVGQKATLVFDALPEKTITGKVVEVDTVGQVSQGVVSYGVKIVFDADVEQVKPGMSVTADIITDAKPDILVLPNSAVKSQGNSYYVELVEADEKLSQQLLANVSGTILPKPPKLQPIEIGLSNDLSTEIISGLKEGDIVVVSTISQVTQTQGTTKTQGFQIPGMTGGSGQMRSFR